MIQFEKEVLNYLRLPSIPLKEWDGKTSFKDGVAVVSLYGKREAYAVATFNADTDKKPNIKKTFSIEPFREVKAIFVVPSYMNVDVEHADADKETKDAMERLKEEAEELENEGSEGEKPDVPENEWCFDEIHNLEEAQAWLKTYNKTNGVKCGVPKKEETVKLRLLAIWKEIQDRNKQ